MQKKITDLNKLPDGSLFKIGVVCADWNEDITSKLLEGCLNTLRNAGVIEDNIKIIHVPGSFELTSGAKILASSAKFDTIICLGCVIKGETNHDDYINSAVANSLSQLSIISNIPFIFGVITTLNHQQALDRVDKGIEAAATGLKMAELKRKHSETKKSIGYQ